jgi:hypothetical protein
MCLDCIHSSITLRQPEEARQPVYDKISKQTIDLLFCSRQVAFSVIHSAANNGATSTVMVQRSCAPRLKVVFRVASATERLRRDREGAEG